MKEHGDEVRQACADGKTLFWASNFSIGVAIFSAVNRYLAKIMNQFPQYDVEMEETHHVHKLIPLTRSICVWIISAVVRYLASIPSAMILMLT